MKNLLLGVSAFSALTFGQLAATLVLTTGVVMAPGEGSAQANVSRCYAYFGGRNDIMVAKAPKSNEQCVAAIRACANDRGLGGWTANWDSFAITLIPRGDGEILICRR